MYLYYIYMHTLYDVCVFKYIHSTVCIFFTNIWTCIDHFLSFCPVQVHMDSFACPSSPLDSHLFIGVNGLKPVILSGLNMESWLEQHQQKSVDFPKGRIVCSWCTTMLFWFSMSTFALHENLCWLHDAVGFKLCQIDHPTHCQTLMDEDTVPLAPAVVQVGMDWCNDDAMMEERWFQKGYSIKTRLYRWWFQRFKDAWYIFTPFWGNGEFD